MRNKVKKALLDKFDAVNCLENGLFKVLKNGEWSILNSNGAPVEFIDGLGLVRDINGKMFHIYEDGTPLYSEKFDYVGPFSKDGLAHVHTKKGQMFSINKDGIRCTA